MPPMNSNGIAKIHWDELRVFLASHLANGMEMLHGCPCWFLTSLYVYVRPEPPNPRSRAREKLTRLTRQQLKELSTDVYDELIRRTSNSEGRRLFHRG